MLIPAGYLREFTHERECSGCDRYGADGHSHTTVTLFRETWIYDYTDYLWAREMRISYLNEMNSHKSTKKWKKAVVDSVVSYPY